MKGCFFGGGIEDFFSFPPQTFEAKLLHIESRAARKSKNSTASDLEFFMRCEVKSSDLEVFINSLKKVADDVRSTPDEKGENILLSILQNDFFRQEQNPEQNHELTFLLFSVSSLVSSSDQRPRQMQLINHKVRPRHGSGPSGQFLFEYIIKLCPKILPNIVVFFSASSSEHQYL